MIWTAFLYAHFAVSREAIKLRTLEDYIWINERFHYLDDSCKKPGAKFGQWCCSATTSHIHASGMERSWSLLFGCSSWLCELPPGPRRNLQHCPCEAAKSRNCKAAQHLVKGEVTRYGCASIHPLSNFSEIGFPLRFKQNSSEGSESLDDDDDDDD
jgi:hypothetical protein